MTDFESPTTERAKGAPSTGRPAAKREHIVLMGETIREDQTTIVVATKMGYLFTWKRYGTTNWYELFSEVQIPVKK